MDEAANRPPAASARVLCIGSALWDIIGRSHSNMRLGSDVPGRISRHPGGVALNIAAALARFGLRPQLLSTIGQDEEGTALIAACARLGIDASAVYRSQDLPTDRYMAIEGANGLIAAIADAHSLEAAGAKILAPLRDGRLARPDAPWRGPVALDGNLTVELLAQIAAGAEFATADLRIAPASPGKAERLRPFLTHPGATLYLNLEEAGILCQAQFDETETAAAAVIARGAHRVLITDGGRLCAEAGARGGRAALPPPVMVTRVTGAGDTFMAAHIAAEIGGADPDRALQAALDAAAAHVSGEVD